MGSVNEIRRSTGELGLEAQKLLKLENQYCVGGFLPLPAYISRGNGVVLFVRQNTKLPGGKFVCD